MTGFKNLLAVAPVFFCALIAGCGKDVFVMVHPPTPATTGTGNWIFNPVLFQNGQPSYFYFFGGSLVNNGGQLKGVLHIDESCFGSYVTDLPYTGTLDTNNRLSIISSPVDGQMLTLQGTLSADASTLNDLTFSIKGGCSGNLTGGTYVDPSGRIFGAGVFVPNFTGTWTTEPLQSAQTKLSFTEQLVQSTTADVNGHYALTGTIAAQGSPCFTKGTLQPESFISGYLGHEFYKMDDGSTLDIPIEDNYALEGVGVNQLGVSSAVISGGGCDGRIPVSFNFMQVNNTNCILYKRYIVSNFQNTSSPAQRSLRENPGSL
jgi:hypothetical protein